MNDLLIDRRNFLKRMSLIGVLGLTSCSIPSRKFIIKASSKTLPKELVKTIKRPWHFKNLTPFSIANPFKNVFEDGTDILAIDDGWLQVIDKNNLKKVDQYYKNLEFSNPTKLFLSSLSEEKSKYVFPLAFSPWVVLTRKKQSWNNKASKSWEFLLDPQLKNKIIFPNNSRLLVDLAFRMKDPNALSKLMLNAKSYDDKNALNWMLSGKASVAILPLNRCLKILKIDPRMDIILPSFGAPMNWTILLNSKLSENMFPEDWIFNSWKSPLLAKLLSLGWIPPISREQIEKNITYIPESYRSIILPAESIWNNYWPLKPLDYFQRKFFKDKWMNSIP